MCYHLLKNLVLDNWFQNTRAWWEDQIKKAHILQSMVDGRKKVPPLQSQVKAMVETTILGEAFVYFDGRPNSAQFLRAAIRPPKSCFV